FYFFVSDPQRAALFLSRLSHCVAVCDAWLSIAGDLRTFANQGAGSSNPSSGQTASSPRTGRHLLSAGQIAESVGLLSARAGARRPRSGYPSPFGPMSPAPESAIGSAAIAGNGLRGESQTRLWPFSNGAGGNLHGSGPDRYCGRDLAPRSAG